MNILKSLTRSPLGLDLYLWLTYRTFNLKRPLRLTWPQLYRQFGAGPARAGDTNTVNGFRTKCALGCIKVPSGASKSEIPDSCGPRRLGKDHEACGHHAQ